MADFNPNKWKSALEWDGDSSYFSTTSTNPASQMNITYPPPHVISARPNIFEGLVVKCPQHGWQQINIINADGLVTFSSGLKISGLASWWKPCFLPNEFGDSSFPPKSVQHVLTAKCWVLLLAGKEWTVGNVVDYNMGQATLRGSTQAQIL
jgi:hypothetical protein